MTNPSKIKNRENWVDNAKAFAIIAVVFGHINFQYPEFTLFPIKTLFASLWHVSVFFMIGGFFLSEDKLAVPAQFIKGKVLRLYLPILYIYMPAVLLHNFFFNIGFYSQDIDYGGKHIDLWSVKDFVVNTVKTIFFAGREPVMGAMWFAYVLFMALCMISILYWLCNKFLIIEHNTKWVAVLLLIAGVAGSILTNKFDITIPRCSNVFTAAWLIFVGMLLRKKWNIQFDNIFCFIVSLIAFYSFAVLRGDVSLNGNNYDDLLSLTISTISALYVVYFLSKMLKGVFAKIFAAVGRDSFWIMGLHLLAFKILTVILNLFGFEQNLAVLCPECKTNIFLLAYYLIGGVCIPIVIIFLFRRLKSLLS